LNSSLLRGTGTFDFLSGVITSPGLPRNGLASHVLTPIAQVSTPITVQPRLGFEKEAISRKGIVLKADELEKEFYIQNRSAVSVRIFVAVSGKARFKLDVSPMGEVQGELSPRGRMRLHLCRRSPSGRKCSISIWSVAGGNPDPVEVMRKGALPEGVSRYKVQVTLEAQRGRHQAEMGLSA
jgi:hypothetical protein